VIGPPIAAALGRHAGNCDATLRAEICDRNGFKSTYWEEWASQWKCHELVSYSDQSGGLVKLEEGAAPYFEGALTQRDQFAFPPLEAC
jgi:hypothetical protein